MSKKNKIRVLILEGESDKQFFLEFKKHFHHKSLDISLLKAKNLNFNKIQKEINVSLKVLKFKEVWLVVDLKTQSQKTGRHFTSTKELTTDYKQQLENTGPIDFVVMVKDLECWLLLYFSKFPDTQRIDDSEKQIKQLMDIKGTFSKIEIVHRLTRKNDFWETVIKNKNQNKSFAKFLEKVDTL
jgi:hypothetical protein